MATPWKVTGIFLCLLVAIAVAQSPISFASNYGNHMVLQRAPQRAIIWGYAQQAYIGEKVIVSLIDQNGIADHTEVIVLDASANSTDNFSMADALDSNNSGEGFWRALLPPMPAGGPYKLEATILETQEFVEVNDVYFGDVWVCGGEAGMRMPVSQGLNATEEIQGSFFYPNVRMFTVAPSYSDTLRDYVIPYLTWSKPSPAVVSGFSSLCWSFGRQLNEKLDVPVGLISVSYGNSRIEAWSSDAALSAVNTPIPPIGRNEEHNKPSVIWNAMLHPLTKSTILGHIWYQGDTNVGKDKTYAKRFAAFVEDIRMQWRDSTMEQTFRDFPVGFVQLGPESSKKDYPSMRWMQTGNWGFVPNRAITKAFMAVTYDLPPTRASRISGMIQDTSTAASRLVAGARAVWYGETKVKYQGPVPTSYTLSTKDQTLILRFDRSLPVQVKAKTGFELCCANSTDDCGLARGNPNWVAGTITENDDFSITISGDCANGGEVYGHRYNWKPMPCQYKNCAVYLKEEDLPAPPYFRLGKLIGDGRTRAITIGEQEP